jgi:hypothetical protein
MEKEFVPYDLSLRMKVLHFDEGCFGWYESGDSNLVINFNNFPLSKDQKKRVGLYLINNSNSSLPQWAVSAPTFSQCFRWFRKEYNLSSSISLISQDYFYEIRRDGEQFIDKPDSYKTYEEAELVCLQELIEIVG